MKRFIILFFLLLITAEWDCVLGQNKWVIRLNDGTEATYDINNIREMFVKEEETYCSLPAKFVMENVYQVPALYIACNSMGEFCTITTSTDGKQFIFNGSSLESVWNINASTSYSEFYLGLSGLIVGLPNNSEESQVVCFDLACSNCYQDYNIARPLTIQNSIATCASCKRTYNLNNVGYVSNGTEGKPLFRYRAKYENYSLVVNNQENVENSSYPPTWKGFVFTRNNQEVNPNTGIYSGDVITVTALQAQKGHLINATTYNWTITIPVEQADGSWKDETITKSVHTNYDGYEDGSNDPSVTFTIPAKAQGLSTIRFSATYAYSAHGIQIEDEGTYESSSNISGSIHSTSGEMYGTANGSARFTVNR